MTLEERLSETRFIRWLVHGVVWPIGCALGWHQAVPQMKASAPAHSISGSFVHTAFTLEPAGCWRCLRCGRVAIMGQDGEPGAWRQGL